LPWLPFSGYLRIRSSSRRRLSFQVVRDHHLGCPLTVIVERPASRPECRTRGGIHQVAVGPVCAVLPARCGLAAVEPLPSRLLQRPQLGWVATPSGCGRSAALAGRETRVCRLGSRPCPPASIHARASSILQPCDPRLGSYEIGNCALRLLQASKVQVLLSRRRGSAAASVTRRPATGRGDPSCTILRGSLRN